MANNVRHTLGPHLIEDRVVRLPESGCWIWEGSTVQGYGDITVQGKGMRAHRLAWEIFKGPIPPGMCVCHTCDIPSCSNPEHLFLGTKKDNAQDMAKKGRQHKVSMPGEKHPLAILKEEDVREIKRSTATGREMALKFGVHVMTISDIRCGRTWRTVE